MLQHFDAFGVPLDRIALATTNPPTTQAACAARSCELCNGLNDPGSRGRAATGPLGYHGQEGYATNCDDPDRLAPLDTADPGYEGYDSTWSAGYEDRSTGILHVGARDYEPATGRFLQPDPVRVGPESLAGMLNRWVYCADDPVNFSDPSGKNLAFAAGLAIGFGVGTLDGFAFGTTGSTGASLLMRLSAVALSIFGIVVMGSGVCAQLSGPANALMAAFGEIGMSAAAATGIARILLGVALFAGILASFLIGFLIGYIAGFGAGTIVGVTVSVVKKIGQLLSNAPPHLSDRRQPELQMEKGSLDNCALA
ncbi:MAG: RHS repeat-associated core domain-containing protein [Phycisphaerae bacterium]